MRHFTTSVPIEYHGTVIRVLDDPAALARAAADEMLEGARAAGGAFRVALSGGKTPRALYALLSDPGEPYRAGLPWDRLHFYWGDERCVPPEDAESNYRSAFQGFLNRVPVPPERVRRIPADLPDPEEAARVYEEILRAELGEAPVFDLMFLGLGPEGHTASLFPGASVLNETRRLTAAVEVPAKTPRRVTVTLPVINAARRAVFLVEGAAKAEIVRRVLEEPAGPDRPASLVRPGGREPLWLLDREAAAALSPARLA
jgi:6-phosphogluconolactonase